ncbi:MAG: PKD domain-containing protein [Candidatus Thermoplasmatota archaeon]
MEGKKMVCWFAGVLAIAMVISITAGGEDTTPPQTIITVEEPNWGILNQYVSSQTPIWINGTDDSSGVNATYYRIAFDGYEHPLNPNDGYCGNTNITYYNDKLWYVRYNNSVDFAPIYLHEECVHTIKYFSIDNATNVENVKTKTFYVDNTPPYSWIVVGDPNYKVNETYYYVKTSTNITILANDYYDGKECVVGNCTIWYRIYNNGWGEWQKGEAGVNVTFNFSQECEHYLEWYAVDALGNNESENGIHNVTFKVDNTPPSSTCEFGSPQSTSEGKTYITSNTPIYLNATDAGCLPGTYIIYYRINYSNSWTEWLHGNLNENITFTLNDLGIPWNEDCEHIIEYYAVDKLGNQQITQSETVYVDNTPPTISKSFEGAQYNQYITSQTTIYVNSTDAGLCPVGSVTLNVSIYSFGTGGWTYYETFVESGTATRSFTIPEECEHWINITAIDDLGNTAYHNETVYVDNTPPTISKSFEGPYYTNGTNQWITSQTKIYVNSTDSGTCRVRSVHLHVKVYNASTGQLIYDQWNNVTSGIARLNFNITEECEHWINITAIDDLGNTAYDNETVYVDNTPPSGTTIEFGQPEYDNWITSATNITLEEGNDGGICKCGIDKIYYRINGIEYEYTAPFTIPDECNHTIEYYAVDYLGNKEPINNITVRVDNTPPLVRKEIYGPFDEINGTYAVNFSTIIHIKNASDRGCDGGVGLEQVVYRIWNGTAWHPQSDGDSYCGNINITTIGGISWYVAINNAVNFTNITFHEECIHYLLIEAYDKLGNKYSDNETFAVDNSKPISWITIGEPRWDGNEYTAQNISTNTIVHLHGQDWGCLSRWKIKYKIDDEDWKEGGWFEVINLTFGSGNHTLEWFATDGVNEEVHHTHNFYVIKTPISNFSYTPSSITTSTIVVFIADEYKNPIINFTWNFGDGYNGYGGIITHHYTSPGMFNVTLTAKAFGGLLEESTTKSLTVIASHPDFYPPVANFKWYPESPYTIDEIEFIDLSYDTDEGGNEILSWLWYFGDGDISTEANPHHKYRENGTYTVTLYVWDDEGAVNWTSKYIVVNNTPPIADFNWNSAWYTVNFIDNSSDPDGHIVNWTWNFGDGNIGYDKNPQHTYSENGIYYVTLTVRDNDGAEASITKEIWVAIQSPVANFTIEPCCGIIGETIYFNSTSYDPDEDIINWTWDFGDGSIGYGEKTTHQYSAAGEYNVILTVTDTDGIKNSTNKTIKIYGRTSFTFTFYYGWNLITIPLTYEGNASDLASLITQKTGANVLAIARWNASRDMFEMWISYDESIDFPIEEGVGYFIYVQGNVTFTLEEHYPVLRVKVPLQARQIPPENMSETNWNLIGWFKYESMNVTQFLPYFVEKVTGINNTTGTQVSIWDAINQGYINYLPIPGWATFFNIEQGMGVFVWLRPIPEGSYWKDEQCP